MIICTDKECITNNYTVGSEEWRKNLLENGICQHDIDLIKEFFIKSKDRDKDKTF